MCERVNTLIEEKCNLEKENTDLQGMVAMLQCQNYILGDQARGYQMVAEKAAVRCAQYKYKKRRGRVNPRKMHAAIASAKADWDPHKWDGDIWDDTDDDVDWGDLEEEAKNIMRKNIPRLYRLSLCSVDRSRSLMGRGTF